MVLSIFTKFVTGKGKVKLLFFKLETCSRGQSLCGASIERLVAIFSLYKEKNRACRLKSLVWNRRRFSVNGKAVRAGDVGRRKYRRDRASGGLKDLSASSFEWR